MAGKSIRFTRKTILLTGGSGVVGQALLEKLDSSTVICLMHRAPVTGSNVIALPGDVSCPRLGLSPHEFTILIQRIDCIIHTAAVTNFNQPKQLIWHTNVDGTKNVLELAATANVPVYYISTAFVHPLGRSSEPNAYEVSKREAERVVRESGLPSIILRPSVVVGDSKTGMIKKFQGLHLIAGSVLTGALPFGLASPRSHIDFIAQDVVANVIVGLIQKEYTTGEYWLTTGDRALTLDNVVDLCVEHAPRLIGRAVDRPRMISLDVFERLIRPVFLPELPVFLQRAINAAIQLSPYLNIEEVLPSSLPELERELAIPLLSNPEDTFVRNLEYWAAANGYRNGI